jgi:tRNA pseudouridine55 synthase
VTVLVVDKPIGPTSFTVVRRVRGALARAWGKPKRDLKVGHGGTLDPMASGVLPICVGEATKLAPFLLDADKEYEATVRFGVETDTLDAEGAVVATAAVDGLDGAAVEAALGAFRGAISQVPPMFSALKRDGRPLYSYARAGESVERAPRQLTVHELVLLGFEPPDHARLRVRCSKGTYVRVLAADLGRALGTGAHLTALRRSASGPFRLEAALPLDEVLRRIDAGEVLPFVSLSDALAHLPAVRVTEVIANALRRGQRVAWTALPGAPDAGSLRVLETDGALVAVVEPGEEGAVRTLRAFNVRSPTVTEGSQGPKNPGSDVDSSSVS